MKLSGEDRQRIRDALLDAFPSPGQLTIVVSNADMGTSFADVSFGATSYEEGIQRLLVWTEGQNRLMKLLKAAADGAPDNPDLAAVTTLSTRYAAHRPDKSFGDAERILFKNVGFQNVGQWLNDLDALRRRVCRIEPQPQNEGIGGYGTGFLIAPHVVITNDHVASGSQDEPGFWNDSERATRVVCRFDYEYKADGKPTAGTAYRLAADYQILRSPISELDFALLKLSTRPGDAPRGFITPTAHTFETSEPLLILQHPMAEPMKLAFGSLLANDQWPANRILYAVNTDGGSSGSPCLTQKLEVGALHHWGAGASNRGVLMSSILAFLKTHPENERLKKAGLAHLFNGAWGKPETVTPGPKPVPPPVPSGPAAVTTLTGPQQKLLQDAVLSLFSRDQLRRMLSVDLDVELWNVVSDQQNNEAVVFELIAWLIRQGRLDEFLTAIVVERPGRADIKQLVATLRGG